jgi:hypothetical protein
VQFEEPAGNEKNWSTLRHKNNQNQLSQSQTSQMTVLQKELISHLILILI